MMSLMIEQILCVFDRCSMLMQNVLQHAAISLIILYSQNMMCFFTPGPDQNVSKSWP